MTNLAFWFKEQNREILLHGDERRLISDASRHPFLWICSLKVDFPEPVIYALGTLENPGYRWLDLQPTMHGCGTGLLISPKHILTAAHVISGLKFVVDKTIEKRRFQVVYAKKVSIIPARNDVNINNRNPFGVYEANRIHISPEFIKGMEFDLKMMHKTHIQHMLPYDYAVIESRPQKLSAVLPGEQTGWWNELSGSFIKPVDTTFEWRLKRAKVNLAGYPGEKGSTPCSTLWHSFDKVIGVRPTINDKILDLLLYQADTSAGMSGSPVWAKYKDGRRYLVGIHSSFFEYHKHETDKSATANVAVLITGKVIRQLNKWGLRNSTKMRKFRF